MQVDFVSERLDDFFVRLLVQVVCAPIQCASNGIGRQETGDKSCRIKARERMMDN